MAPAKISDGRRAAGDAPQATRAALLEAALTLFAARGVDAVSLREIGLAAGQRNTGVVNYYFADRNGLLDAVVQSFSDRHPGFAAEAASYLPGGSRPSARQVAGALVRPMALLRLRDPDFIQLVARLASDEGRRPHHLTRPAASWYFAVEELIAARFGGGVHRSTRARFAETLTVHALADDARRSRQADPAVYETFVEELVTAVAAILSAASPRT